MLKNQSMICKSVRNEPISLETVRKNYKPGEENRIVKNLIIAGFSFILLFSSFGSVVSIQSSLHRKNGLGAYSLAAIYLSSCISSFFLFSFLLSKFKCKDAIFYSIFPYLAYVAAQFYPNFATLIPTAVIVGISAGAIWNSVSTYISQISQEYSYLTGEDFGTILARFFGLFFVLFQSSIIWGNLIIIGVFSTATDTIHLSNSTLNSNESTCGVDFCPVASSQSNSSNSTTFSNLPDKSTLQILFGVYFVCTVVALIIIRLWLDPLSRYGEGCTEMKTRVTGKQLIFGTMKQMGNPYQIALIPFIFFSTFQTGFYNIDFTAAFITCAWGVQNIGQVMICYGICCVSSSLLFSRMIKYTGRLPVFSIIVATNVTAHVLMLNWSPDASQPIEFFLIAGMFGVSEGVMSPQVSAFAALLFDDNKQAAFNNLRLWQGLGYIAAYVNATLFCIEFKLYLLIAVALFSYLCYIILEICYARSLRQRDIVNDKN